MSFDPKAALDKAQEVVAGRYADVVLRAEAAREAAMEAAREYAKHLASGGDPREYPSVPYSNSQHVALIDRAIGMTNVYRMWNEARGSTNTCVPLPRQRDVQVWQVAEYLHAHVGEAVTFATLAVEYRVKYENGYSGKGTPEEVADAVIAAQTETLIARKTKLGSKVAYVLREKREGEERASNSWNFPVEGVEVAAGG